MKTLLFKIYFLFFIGLIALASCTKLESKIYSRLPTEEFFADPKAVDNAQDLVTIAMPELGNGEQIRLSNASGGQLLNLFNRQTDNSSSYMKDAYLHNFDKNLRKQPWNLMWTRDFYAGISKANLTLSELESLKTKSKNIRKVIADIKVARAYFFLQVLDCFGNAPLDTLFGADPKTVKTNSRLEIYNFVEKELRENIPFLDTRTNPKNRMNKYVGYAMLAQLYLNAQVYSGTAAWDKVVAPCDSVLKGPYSLTSNYFSNFEEENATSENMLLAFRNIGKVNTFILENLHEKGAPAIGVKGAGWSAFVGSADAYNIYDAADKRRNMWLVGPQREAAGSERIIDGVPNTGPLIKFIAKVRVPGSVPVRVIDSLVTLNHQVATPRFGITVNNPRLADLEIERMVGVRNVKYYPKSGIVLQNEQMSNDYVLLRLADVILMKAEALVRIGNSSAAKAELDKITTRAYGSSNFNILNPTIEDIYNERYREFMWEGHSRRDNIRFEIANPSTPYWSKARPPLKPNADTGSIGPGRFNNMLYPIPAEQLLLNPRLVQNPGYN